MSWNLVPAVDRNGDITQYGIEYNQITFPQRPTSVTESLAAGNVSWTLSGLEEYVVYTVRVRAHTVIGAGPYSSPMTSRTLEDGVFFIFSCSDILQTKAALLLLYSKSHKHKTKTRLQYMHVHICVFNMCVVRRSTFIIGSFDLSQCLLDTQTLYQPGHYHQLK